MKFLNTSLMTSVLLLALNSNQLNAQPSEVSNVTEVANAGKTKVINDDNTPFSQHLAKFEGYLGGWTSTFSGAQGEVTDITLFEKVLNGKALRTTHSINDGVYGGESIIFWNNKSNRLEFHYFTTADFFTTGWLEFTSENSFVAYENVTGKSAMSSGITQVKSTSSLLEDTMTVSTSYLKDGSWTPPQQRVYTRTDKNVVFQ